MHSSFSRFHILCIQKERNNSDVLLFKKIQEDMQTTLNKMKHKLEKETVGHLEANQKIAELEYRINELNLMVCIIFLSFLNCSKFSEVSHLYKKKF